jgi:hypothetical protein
VTAEPTASSHRRWSNRPLVRERDELRVRLLWRSLVAIVIAFAPAAAYLLEQNECLQLTYAISAHRAKQEELIELERKLKLERVRLESLASIERWAVRERRMVRPDAEHVIVIGRGRPDTNELVARTLESERPPVR